MNTEEFAGDADSLSTLFEKSGSEATSSTLRVVVAMSLTTGDQNIRDVTKNTQIRWATRWRQRLREFDSDTWESKSLARDSEDGASSTGL